jgi:hypothetical protein
LSESEDVLERLATTAPAGVFNQYAEADPALDLPDAAARRCANLARYLTLFAEAEYLLVGEAAGFGACRFSGIPFVDERKLVGPDPLPWAGAANGFLRCSRLDRPLLAESSAGVVWRALGSRRDVALWNLVPWHPAGPRGPLSNRLPAAAARRAGLELLDHVLSDRFPRARPLAVGRLAETALRELGRPSPYLRHPAHGGQPAFLAGLTAALA